MNTLGLILDAFGAILILIGSEIMGSILVKFIDHMKGSYGTYGMTKFPTEFIAELAAKKSISRVITWFGLLLFAVGFVLQIIYNLKNN